MQNMHFRRRLPTISAIGLLTVSLGMSLPVTAGTVMFADPQPSDPAPACNGGISYEWKVEMGGHDEVSFVNKVGAKSYNEPPPYASPETGWTHTSNWVALELTQRSKLKIKLERQEGVPYTNGTTIATARNKLVPALSIYSGWDNTSCEEHRYNTSGNSGWTTVQYIGSQPNTRGKKEVEYEIMLNAGKYSIAIGGTPKVLADYSILTNCNPADPVCYAYKDNHGYRVEMKTDKH